MCTGLPSKSTSPSSNGWMPAIDLISVDLPAPLSPTRAITSPSRTAKSTSFSACTEPNALETPRSSSVGASFTGAVIPHNPAERVGPTADPLRRSLLLAVLRVLADADLAPLHEAVREELGVVLLGDPHRRQQD